MGPGDFNMIAGKQRAVWAQSGGFVLVGNLIEHIQAVVIEAGTAVRESFINLNDTVQHNNVVIPIMVVPASVFVVKTVAMAAPATIAWNELADSSIWGVDEVNVEEDKATRQLSLIASVAEGGEGTAMLRIAYHITMFIQGRKYVADPGQLRELETA